MVSLRCLLAFTLTASAPAETDSLVRFTHSPGYHTVRDLNSPGLILEEREVVEPSGVSTLTPFLRQQDRSRPLPIPEDFTHREVYRLSDSGMAVGFASRPMGHPQGSQRACVWDAASGRVELLELPDSYRGSCAFDINAQGTTISGFLTGRDPPRLLPCVWRREPTVWRCTPLSVLQPFNPLLSSGHVVLSDNGQQVAASLVVESIGDDLPYYVNHLFVWQKQANDSWSRRRVAKQAVHVANINNAGLVVGRTTERGHRRAFVYDPQRGAITLPPLAGDVNCQATDVNNRGTVIGWSDDPPGPEGGTQAFLWRNGQQSLLPLPPEAVYSSVETITDEERVGGWLFWQTSSDDAGRNFAFVLSLSEESNKLPLDPPAGDAMLPQGKPTSSTR